MCRLLAVTSAVPFAIADYVRPFAEVARCSCEYQGHGWGCAWQQEGAWRTYHSVRPVWEDDRSHLGHARVLLVHARSAFRDEGVSVENNMPFVSAPLAFVFNGELHGVRIAERGRIGAEKLFRFLTRDLDGADNLRRGVETVEMRSRRVRAMNFVIGAPGRFLVCCWFNEDPHYFTPFARRGRDSAVVCSRPLGDESGWRPIGNHTVEEIPWFS